MKRTVLFLAVTALLAACSGPGNNPANSAESPDQTGTYAPDSSASTDPYPQSADTLRPADTTTGTGDLSP